ncbi:hypothetical protein [Cellulomonas sp. KRMCY2]|uniref:hypothetical protein n=1 Tax=Cellulomonas sp. KRMCY2 TaxID=1304865 RepID=UPI0012DF13E1|nr:hypothetical protein [Cellulomonas sp. KRMCY2]
MDAKTVGFAFDDEDRSIREASLRAAEAQARAERLVVIQARMHVQLGRALTTEDVPGPA